MYFWHYKKKDARKIHAAEATISQMSLHCYFGRCGTLINDRCKYYKHSAISLPTLAENAFFRPLAILQCRFMSPAESALPLDHSQVGTKRFVVILRNNTTPMHAKMPPERMYLHPNEGAHLCIYNRQSTRLWRRNAFGCLHDAATEPLCNLIGFPSD
jgi:hypothetical protein